MIRVNRAIRKVVALGAGATMLGATIFGAMAADLSDYPTPFVQNGKFNAKIVVGEKAATSDVIGAIDIANSLQFASRVAKPLPGSGGTTTVDGGINLAASGRDIYMTDAINVTKQVITDADMPNLLKQGTVTNEDGTYTYNQQVALPGGALTWGDIATDNTNDPFVYIKWATNDGYKLRIIFPQATNLTLADNEQITLFGKPYTISGTTGEVSGTKVTLYSSAVDKVFTAGESATVDIGGASVQVSIGGANSDQSTAVVTINGETKSVTKGNTYTIGGQKVYVNDVFITTVPTPTAAVRLFIGSKKLILENGAAVQIGTTTTTDITGSSVTITSSSGKISEIAITIKPREVQIDQNTRDYVKAGEEFVDPVFGTLKLLFADLSPALDSTARDTIILNTADPYLKLTFTNRDGNTYTGLRIAEGNTTNSGFWLSANQERLEITPGATLKGTSGDKSSFILDADGYTQVLRLDRVYNSTSEAYIKLYDYATGQTTDKITATITGANTGTATYTLAGKTYTFTVGNFTGETATVSPTNVDYMYTKGGAKITLTNASGGNGTTLVGTFASGSLIINITEETNYNDWSGTPNRAATVAFQATHNVNNSDNDIRLASYGGTSLTQTSDSDIYKLVTSYGTYLKMDNKNYDVWAWYPKTQMKANVFIAPAGASASSSGSSAAGTYYETSRIQVGAAVLDTEVLPTYQDSNLIVVGGPCVNTVAAKLRNNPAQCSEGFKDGEAIIKLYDTGKGKVSLLVAGMTAQDTVVASKVVAQANSLGNKKLMGSEVKTQTVTESVVTVSST